jgi:hypothetical protein
MELLLQNSKKPDNSFNKKLSIGKLSLNLSLFILLMEKNIKIVLI